MQQNLGPGFGTATAVARPKVLERRANRRYDIVVEFDLFHLWGARHLVWCGSGKTRNWSRTSILIESENPLPVGTSVELIARWTPAVQLVVVGRVLQSGQRGTVVRILRKRFRREPDSAEIPAGGRTVQPPAGRERAS